MKKKLNLKNLFVLIAFVLSTATFLRDVYLVGFKYLITNTHQCFTEAGMITFGLSILVMILSFDFLDSELKEKGK